MGSIGEGPRSPAIGERVTVFPNPGSARATIAYSVARAGQVRLRLYGADGRRVATLVNDFRGAGEHRLTDWQRTDDHGRALAAGLYYLRLDTASGRLSSPVAVTR